MSTIEPYNPSQHGGITESWTSHSRSGAIFFIIGLMFLVLAMLLFYFFIWDGMKSELAAIVGFWISFGLGAVLLIIGIYNLTLAQAFTSRIKVLKNDGKVTRGSILSVRHTYRIFGATWGTSDGDLLGRDSGWFYKVTYSFDDDKGKQRQATGVIQDPLGAKRGESNQTTFIDSQMPRVGNMVDILFNVDESAILRIIQAS